jgi:ribulose bisphosphate carboxylase small subunit
MKGLLEQLQKQEKQDINKTKTLQGRKKTQSLKENVHDVLLFLSENKEEYPKVIYHPKTKKEIEGNSVMQKIYQWRSQIKNREEKENMNSMKRKTCLSQESQDYIEMAGIELFEKQEHKVKKSVCEILLFLSENSENPPKYINIPKTEKEKIQNKLSGRIKHWKQGIKNRELEENGENMKGKFCLSQEGQDYIEMAGIDLLEKKA